VLDECLVQERDKILHEVSEREERLQKERDTKDKLQKQIQVINWWCIIWLVWRVTLPLRMLAFVICWMASLTFFSKSRLCVIAALSLMNVLTLEKSKVWKHDLDQFGLQN